jgi:NADPH:quinone reductase-like Zn-dependent oxidoreductase
MIPTTQKQYQLHPKTAGVLELLQTEQPVRPPGDHEILVRIRALSLNRRDILISSGKYPLPSSDDGFVPLSDAAGDVVSIGKNVSRFKPGDRAVSCFYPKWLSGRPSPELTRDALGVGKAGMLSEYVTANEESFVAISESLSYQDACTLPCAAVTAWNGLEVLGRVQADDTVLIQGTGGVSLFALQFSVGAGAKPIVLSSSNAKLERVKALGAVGTVNTSNTPEWVDAVRALTGGRGVDQVVEVGGVETLPKSIKALASGGHIAIIGGLGGFPQQLAIMDILLRSIRIAGVTVGSRAHLESLIAFMQQHKISPVIDSVFAFTQANLAYERMSSPELFGKVIIEI